MSMLDRIKKRQNDGFKEFVVNMETTSPVTRAQIFTAGVLEDPVYMNYVVKNIRGIEDFLKLDSDEVELVLNSQEQLIGLLAKCLHGLDDEKFSQIDTLSNRHKSKLKDELSYIKEVMPADKEAAKSYIIKLVRKFQMEERIHGFKWMLPPQDIYFPTPNKDGESVLNFENGIIAATGSYFKNKRTGLWRHNYINGNILAEGDYSENHKTGVWSFYYINGKLKSQGKYKADLKHGTWKEWDRNENVTEIEYNEGVKAQT